MIRQPRAPLSKLALLAPTLTLVLMPLGSHAVAASVTSSDQVVGDWTPDKTSNAQFTGNYFTVATVAASPRDLVTDPPLQAQFDDYCNPNIAGGPVTYYTLTYTWSPTGQMGGCTSPTTKGHVYVWGAHDDIAYVHPGTVDGEDVLQGGWGIENFTSESASIKYLKITAHRPLVSFVTHIRNHVVLPGSRHPYRETVVSGLGRIRLNTRPAGSGCGSESWDAFSSDGSIDIEVTKVGGPNVIELYDLTLDVGTPTHGDFRICDGGSSFVDNIPLTVRSADPADKDACPKGTKGGVTLDDQDNRSGGDFFRLSIPTCHLVLHVDQSRAKKGDHVAVALDLSQNGY